MPLICCEFCRSTTGGLHDVTCISDDDVGETIEAFRYNGNMEREAEIKEEYRRRYKGKLKLQRYMVRYIAIFTHPYFAVLSFYETFL